MNYSLKDFPFFLHHTVSWGDMDAFKHVNNTNFFKYFENVRIAYLEKAGVFSVKSSTLPILASISCKFIAPVYYPDSVILTAKVSELFEDRFTMIYGVFHKKSNKCLAIGSSCIVSFDYDRKIKVKLPSLWSEGVASIENSK